MLLRFIGSPTLVVTRSNYGKSSSFLLEEVKMVSVGGVTMVSKQRTEVVMSS